MRLTPTSEKETKISLVSLVAHLWKKDWSEVVTIVAIIVLSALHLIYVLTNGMPWDSAKNVIAIFQGTLLSIAAVLLVAMELDSLKELNQIMSLENGQSKN